jgi:hypothetical protein
MNINQRKASKHIHAFILGGAKCHEKIGDKLIKVVASKNKSKNLVDPS